MPAIVHPWRESLPRFVVTLVLLAIGMPSLGLAEVTIVDGQGDQEGLTTFKLTVTPAAEPTPALKYRFTVPELEIKPGNAAPFYYRSLISLQYLSRGLQKKYGDDWSEYASLPTDQFSVDLVREMVGGLSQSSAMDALREAVRRERCDWDWQIRQMRGVKLVEFLLPEVQVARDWTRLLALVARLQIVEGDYEAAIHTLMLDYEYAQDLARVPFFVNGLVAIAKAGILNQQVIYLIGSPNSPNLYWALSELPQPFVDMRETVRSEMAIGLRIFPMLQDAETAEHSSQEWDRLLAEAVRTLKTHVKSWGNSGTGFYTGEELLRLLDEDFASVAYPAAKQRLLDAGMEAGRVEPMAVGQVLLIDAAREYRRLADESEKWWYAPYPAAHRRMEEAEEESLDLGSQAGFGQAVVYGLLPALRAARMAQIRLEWQMNALRVVEAVRMHAAETGRLPQTLDEISVVPVPLNPIIAQPYAYRLEGQTAVLELPFSDGMPGVAWRFEIQLAGEAAQDAAKQ